jgi:hypothetical protein
MHLDRRSNCEVIVDVTTYYFKEINLLQELTKTIMCHFFHFVSDVADDG